MMKPFGFPKNERLCSKKSIDLVFSQGESVFVYPLKCIYLLEEFQENQTLAQVLFIVPKKKIKKATDRNRIRRRLKEAYRLNKKMLTSWSLANSKAIKVIFVYVSSDEIDFHKLQDVVISIMVKIIDNQKCLEA